MRRLVRSEKLEDSSPFRVSSTLAVGIHGIGVYELIHGAMAGLLQNGRR